MEHLKFAMAIHIDDDLGRETTVEACGQSTLLETLHLTFLKSVDTAQYLTKNKELDATQATVEVLLDHSSKVL